MGGLAVGKTDMSHGNHPQVCANGPRVGKVCTNGQANVCQGGTERDGTFCDPSKNLVEQCGAMGSGRCGPECPPGPCPAGKECSGADYACESELSFCDREENLAVCARGCFEFRGRALMIIFDRNKEPSESVGSGQPLVKQPTIALIDDLGKAVIPPSIYSPWDDQKKQGSLVKVSLFRLDSPASAGPERALGGEFGAVRCPDGTFSTKAEPCFELDQPLNQRFTSGNGLTEGEMVMSTGKADFTDITFNGHPSQYYNVTFTLQYRVQFKACRQDPPPEACGTDLAQPVQFITFFTIETKQCPLGQIGDTTDTLNQRPCVCDRGYTEVSGGLCEACDPGKLSGETGTYKDWRGPAACQQCPDVNMITECSNFTGCGQRYNDDNIAMTFVPNSLQNCWCKAGYFRVSMLYQYVAFKTADKGCHYVPTGSTAEDVLYPDLVPNKGWVDVYDGGREKPLSCRPTKEPYEFCYKENSPSDSIAALQSKGELCSTCSLEMKCSECELGACCDEPVCLEYEHVDRGRIWSSIARSFNPGDSAKDPRPPESQQTVNDGPDGQGPMICTQCPHQEACDEANKEALEKEDPSLLEPCGCQGDGFGLGTQSCGPLYRGLLCSTCIKGFYPDANGRCVRCPGSNDYLLAAGYIILGGSVLGYLWAKYGDAIELMFDPGLIKVIISYLMVTGSVNSGMGVPGLPDWAVRITETLKFDPSGVLKCLIQAFEYTFYHNVVLMATVPYVASLLMRGLTAVVVSIIKVTYINKRKIAQDDEELEALEEEEAKQCYEVAESINGMMFEFLIFVHPNITEVMFGMLADYHIHYRLYMHGITYTCTILHIGHVRIARMPAGPWLRQVLAGSRPTHAVLRPGVLVFWNGGSFHPYRLLNRDACVVPRHVAAAPAPSG